MGSNCEYEPATPSGNRTAALTTKTNQTNAVLHYYIKRTQTNGKVATPIFNHRQGGRNSDTSIKNPALTAKGVDELWKGLTSSMSADSPFVNVSELCSLPGVGWAMAKT